MNRVTCGDLALLGGPWDALARHDPDRQTADETHCYCWREPTPEDWSPGVSSPPDLPARLLEQECRVPLRFQPESDIKVEICCRCREIYEGVMVDQRHHSRTGGALLTWLRQQVRAALAYRDRRRLDSSPCVADVDLEVAALEVEW